MAAIAADDICVYERDTGLTQFANDNNPLKEIIVEIADTADTGDTVAITLADYGITTIAMIKGWVHTVDAMALEAPTTAVSSGVLTITLGGTAADNLRRTYLVSGV